MKFLGYILYGFGILLIISIIGRLGKFISDIIRVFKIFSLDITGLERGQIIGSFIFWILLIIVIYYLFKFGNKYTR